MGQDKRHLNNFTCLSPIGFHHLDKLLEHEIVKVRSVLFQNTERPAMSLPEADGATIVKTHKVWVPVKENPEYNFVGRILGPRGLTAKQLEQETQCKIMVRGKGSMRDKKKEEQNRGKPNWEHLNEELHVLITVEDSENRAQMKLQRAIDEVKKLLVVTEGEDELKKRQLMELAIMNGTYRDSQSKNSSPGLDGAQRLLVANSQAALQTMMNQQNAAMRGAAPLGGAPLILSPRLQVPTSLASGLLNGSGTAGPPPLIAAGDTSGLLYAQYAAAASAADYANYSGLVNPLLAAEYSPADPSAGQTAVVAAAAANSAVAAAGGKDRRHLNGQSVRQHPYPPRT